VVVVWKVEDQLQIFYTTQALLVYAKRCKSGQLQDNIPRY